MSRHSRAFSFIEVLVSALCLSVLAVGVAASVDFSSKQAVYASENACAEGKLRQLMDTLRGQAEAGTIVAGTTTTPYVVTGLPTSLSVVQTVTAQSGSTTLYDVTLTGTWTHGSTQTVNLTSSVYVPNTLTALGTYNITPAGTFSTYAGTRPATVVDLGAAGITSGMTINIQRQGYFNTNSTNSYGVYGVFSSSNSQRTDTATPQIPGAISSGAPGIASDPTLLAATASTYASANPAEAFLVSQSGLTTTAQSDNVTVTVPTGAAYLYLEGAGGTATSNTLGGSSYFRVVISKVTRSYTSAADGPAKTSYFNVAPGSTFSSTATGARPATVVDLNALGIYEGATITLTTVGNYYYGGYGGGVWYGMLGVFSTSNTQLTTTGANQIPGAVGCGGTPAYADPGPGWGYASEAAVEYPSSYFLISSYDGTTQTSTTVVVPAGAKYLFLSSEDVYGFQDNYVGSAGSFKVKIDYTGKPPSGNMVLADSQDNWGDQGEGCWQYGYYPSNSAASVTASTFTNLYRTVDIGQKTYNGYTLHQEDAYNYTKDTWANNSSYLQITNTYISPDKVWSGGPAGTPCRRWTAPVAYTSVTLTGSVQNLSGASNVAIAKNTSTSLWYLSLSDHNVHTFSVSAGAMAAGDSVELRVSGDHFSPTLYYLQISGQ